MYILYDLIEEFSVLGVGEDLAGVVVVSEGLLVLVQFFIEYFLLFWTLDSFVAGHQFVLGNFAEAEAIEVVHVLVDYVFWRFSWGFVRGHDKIAMNGFIYALDNQFKGAE